jgi:hypothetical protein
MSGDESKLLPHLKAHIALAKEIEREFVTEAERESDETEKKNNFFIYHFLHRTIAFGASIELLVEKGFYHEAVLVARTVLEGTINFEYYRDHHDIADKWFLFKIYEDGKTVANTFMLDATRRWLATNSFNEKLVDRAEREFGFNYLPKETLTFSKKSLSDLINRINDTRLRRVIRHQYDTIYYEFSQIVHWSPSGVAGGEINAPMAVTVAIDSLFEMLKEANQKYRLGFNKSISKVHNAADETVTILTGIKTEPNKKQETK